MGLVRVRGLPAAGLDLVLVVDLDGVVVVVLGDVLPGQVPARDRALPDLRPAQAGPPRPGTLSHPAGVSVIQGQSRDVALFPV